MTSTALRIRILIATALIACALTTPLPLQGLSSTIVISQVYGGGGNAGATYKNDFIELYNRGTAAVDVTGWSVQYAGTTGTTWQKTDLTGTIEPGHYYLVQQAAGAGGTTNLPTPDASGGILMAGGAGKVALLNTNTLIAGGTSCPSGVTLIDFVGYGTGTNCFEGSGPTPTLSNTTAALRNGNGTVETDSNPNDFAVGAPRPGNNASGRSPFGTAAANPASVPPGASTLLTVAVIPGAGPSSTDLTVTGNLTNIGGPSTQSFTDAGTGGDVTAGDNIFSFETFVPGGTTGGGKLIPITVADAQSRSTTASATVTVIAPVPPSTTVVISQVYGGGGNAGATLTHDYVELYNLGDATIVLTGWSIQYSSATGTTWQKTDLTGTILPGRYYLIQEAQGSGGTQSLPPPDATGTIAMAAGSGKIALVNNTAFLSGSCPATSVIDFVGYGTANCSEASPTPALSNTTAALRLGNGSIDTNNNLNDFTVGAPSPHNSSGFPPTGTGAANPASASPLESTLLSVAVTPGQAPSAGGITVAANLTPIGGAATQSLRDDGLNGDLTAGDNVFSVIATVAAGTPPGPKSMGVSVADALGRTTSTAISFAVETTPSAIHSIQSSSTTSPFVGQFVTTSGIVIGMKSNGFFVQTPDTDIDADPNSSEGIFVFTGGAPAATVARGNLVRVSGTVTEFIPSADPVSPPFTEIGGGGTPPVAVRLISTMNVLPTAVTLTAGETSPSGTLEQLERFEGMRVRVDFLRVVAPTGASFVDEEHATSTTNGVFYGVVDGVPRPLREPGLEVPGPLPAGAPCCIPRFDGNPEKLRVDSDGQPGATPIEIATGALVSNLVGPLDYSFRTYTILPDPASPPAVPFVGRAQAVPVPDANELTIGAFNLERFFDTSDDPNVDDVVLTTAAFENRLSKASLAIRHVMLAPDVLGVEEVENLPTLSSLAARINADAMAAGEANPQYQAYLVEGNDIGGIDSGFLVKQARVSVLDVTQEGKTATFIDPGDGSTDLLNDRPPLLLRAEIQSPIGTHFPITVIVNHLRSLSGIEDTDGDRIRAKRRAQAEFLANLIQARQMANPAERIVSVGDYNAFQFNDGYVDVMGTIKGTPTPANQVMLASADLVNPDLVNLVDTLPPSQRYSFTFDGNAQVLDHVLVNAAMFDRFSRFQYARNDADFPESLRGDPNRPERVSDHDMPVAYFFFHTVPVLTLNGPNPMTVECHTSFTDPGATARDEALGDLTSQIQVSGHVDPHVPGTYTLTYTVSNGILSTTIVRTVNVVDTTPPEVTTPSVSASMIWPPNHRMVDIFVSYGATDTCDPDVACALTVSSSESIDGAGDGATAPDWEVIDAHHVRLRAERAGGGGGRIYTITVTCKDEAGNNTVRTVTVAVRRN